MHPYKYTYYFSLYCSFSYSSHLLKNNLKAKLILIGLCLLDATFPITQNKQITLIWWKCMDLPKWELTGKNRVVCILWELLAPDWHTHKGIAIDSFSFLAWDLYEVFRRYQQCPCWGLPTKEKHWWTKLRLEPESLQRNGGQGTA